MFYLLISFLSFLLLSKSFSHKRLPPWEPKMSLLSAFLVSWFHKSRLPLSLFQVLYPPLENIPCSSKLENNNVEEKEGTSLLDLPELALESILDRLSPAELCKVASVCSYLRDVCGDDHLWEKRMKQKWGKLMGDSACKEWHMHMGRHRRKSEPSTPSQNKGLLSSYFGGWFLLLIRPKSECKSKTRRSCLPFGSIKAWYLSLESGKLWFSAQVYNRENGHAGFMLSCYDAQVCYDLQTDMFRARYLPHGRAIEEDIAWNRLRAAPIDIPPRVLHVSDCLADLKPGDHIEIQWRRSKEFSYGWWFGVVAHLEACDGNVNKCHCCCNDMVAVEFGQYSVGSRWRMTVINRKSHKEEGNEADGYYGGLRKLYKSEEITRWKCFWPNRVLE